MKGFSFILIMVCSCITFLSIGQPKSERPTEKYLNELISTTKQFETERITINKDTILTSYCMNAECTQFLSWHFNIHDIANIDLKQDGDSYYILFACRKELCIKPPVIGSIYSPKSEYSMYVKSQKQGEFLISQLKAFQNK